MSVDLDRIYAKLAEQSDSARIPTLQGVLDRARQRRRRTVATAVSAVLVVAMFVGARVFLAPTPSTMPPTVTPDPVSWVSFDADAKPVFAFKMPVQFGYTVSDDKRSYAMWRAEDGEQWVGAVDLATGKALWEPVSLGKFGDSNGMDVSSKAILLLTEQGFDNPLIQNGSDTIIAVDPETGRIMWTLPYSFNDTTRVLYDDTLVISWHESGKTEALDARTGRPKWMMADPVAPGAVNPMRRYEEFQAFRGWSYLPIPTDRRVVLHLTDGRLQIRDVDTGKVLRERSGVPVEADPQRGHINETVVGDTLYQADAQGILKATLTGSGPPSRLYTTPPGTSFDGPLIPCGPTLLCISLNLDNKSAEVVLLDNEGRELWRRPAPVLSGAALPSDTGIVLIGRGEPAAAYDMKGNRLLPSENTSAMPMWVDSGNLLLIEPSGITGYSLANAKSTVLGKPTITGYCSWNTTMLTCPTDKGISVWRYAN